MADAARAARLADRIKVIVAQALERRIKDPRLGFVTVTDARVTNDLQHATLYYTVYGDEEQREETARALESAKGIVRRNGKARLVRDGSVVQDNLTIDSLRRFKDDATEVREGYECGIGLGSFNDIHEGDIIETWEMREKPRD